MRNSTFTPRNRFAQKALSITTKVMIFGVLLSLFLFACVGIDTLEEVAQAALSGDYADDKTSGLTFKRDGATVTTQDVGREIKTFSSTVTLLAANTNDGWRSSTKGTEHATGWYIIFSESMYYAIQAGQVKTIESNLNLKIQNLTYGFGDVSKIYAGYYKKENTTVRPENGSTSGNPNWTSNRITDYGTKCSADSDPKEELSWAQTIDSSKMSTGTGTYYFYTKLDFQTENTDWLNPGAGKTVDVAPIGSGIFIDLEKNETTAPVFHGDYFETLANGNLQLKNDTIYISDQKGAGVRYVKITGGDIPSNNPIEFYAPSPTNSGKNVNGGNNITSDRQFIDASFGQLSSEHASTSKFTCRVTKAGTYTIYIEDHLGNNQSKTVVVPAGDLVLEDPLNSANTKTITGVINNVNATYTVPQADANALFSNAYGVDNVSGWIVASDSEGSATLTANGKYPSFTVTSFKSVTLNIVWQGYEFGKDENNTGVWGSAGNPYLIQTDQHLKNLARIVNGELSPLMSVSGKGLNPTSAQATAVTYAGAYFRLDNSLNGTAPIGKNSTNFFAGTFDGNGKKINFTFGNSDTSYVGVFGYIGTGGIVYDLTVESGVGTISGKDYIGGIAGYNAGTITNCKNIGATIQSTDSNYVGGIAGYNAGTISGCEGNARAVIGKDCVGGISGVNAGTIENCTSKSQSSKYYIAGYGSKVGGIVGENSGTVRYCVNSGLVEATGTNAGGIIGENISGTVEYVYNFGTVVSEGGAFGGVVGASSSAVKGYAFVTSIPNNGNDCTGTANTGYYVSASQSIIDSVKPMIDSEAKTLLTWEDIRTNNFDGFTFVGLEAPYGQYLSLQMGSDGFAQPTNTPVSTDVSTDDGEKLTFDYVSYSSAFNPQGNIEVVLRVINLKNKDGEVELDHDYYNSGDGVLHMVYDGRNKLDLIESDITIDGTYDRGYSAGMETYVGSNKISSYVYPSIVSNSGQATVYSIATNSATNDVVWGKYALKIKIVAFDLNADYAQYYYDGTIYGNTNTIEYDSKTLHNITNESAIGVTSENTIYIFRKLSNGRLIYVEDIDYKNASSEGTIFTDDYKDEAVELESGLVVSVIEFTHSAPVRNEHGLYASQTTLNGELCWTGTRTLNYFIVDSDFGKKTGATGAWGSSTNPYVISHWVHLIRLSEIVNKVNDPIDSVTGKGTNPTNVKANNIFFTGGCYFEVQGTITLPEGIHFLPIGGSEVSGVVGAYNGRFSYFGGNIYGTGVDADATIILGDALANYGDREYVGLFGLVAGTKDSPATIVDIMVKADTIIGGTYVGSLVGRADRYVIIDNTDEDGVYTIGSDKTSTTATISGVDSVGGLVGYAGLGTEIYGKYVNEASVSGSGEYIGGFIGKLVAGAGKQGTGVNSNIYYFGNVGTDAKLSFENRGDIFATQNGEKNGNFVGGFIGGTVDNEGDYSAVETYIQPTFIRNLASVSGTSYVGGFIGQITDKVVLKLTNSGNDENNWSYNGDLQDNTDVKISGTADNVGGLVGTLGIMSHELISVFNTMNVSGGGKNIGGLIGYMNNGTIDYSFVTIPGTNKVSPSTTSIVSGAENVGGLVGYMNNGHVKNSYAQGFGFDLVDSTIGGVVGFASSIANSNITNSWALYITGDKDDVTYQTVARNPYGKYVLTYGNAHATATIYEMLVFAGLKTNSDLDYSSNAFASNKNVIAEKGKISLGLTLPIPSDNHTDAKEKLQLTFFDASGYENVFDEPFDGAGNDDPNSPKMLYIRLDTSIDSSLIIAATAVHFGTIPDYKDKEDWEAAYSNITSDENLYVLVMENDGDALVDSNGNYIPSFIIKYNYDQAYDVATSTGNYVYTSRHITRTYTSHSEVAPLIISNETDWINFANSIKSATPTTYLNEYVKLANDITVSSTSYMAGVHDNENKTFQGTFDGDGYTITINFNANGAEGVSLFPYARDAVFKNLTIDGKITNASLDTAGFVGQARGPLTFENCTNSVDISGTAYSVGGFIGSTFSNGYVDGYSYKFTGCVNEGTISVYKNVGQVTFNTYGNKKGLLEDPLLRLPEFNGVGGFIGTVYNGTIKVSYDDVIDDGSIEKNTGIKVTENSNGGEPVYGYYGTETINGTQLYQPFESKPVVIMDSCRNAGTVIGSYNVGGLIGLNGGNTEIMNCGNTGNVDAVGEGNTTNRLNRWSRSYQVTDDESSSPQATIRYIKERVYLRRYLNAGGLVGLSTSQGHVDMYTSYNAGTIHAWGNNAGGLIASDTEYTAQKKSSTPTKIYYCYNVGEVITGANKYTVFHAYNDDYSDLNDEDVNTNEDYTKHHAYLENVGLKAVKIDDRTESDKQVIDHYEMSIRHEDRIPNENSTREGGSFGIQVGGIIGATTNTDINYCYNIGTIICRGLVPYAHRSNGIAGWTTYTEYHGRAGGIVGYVDKGTASVSNSYNVGDIKLEARHAYTGTFGLESLIGQLSAFRQTRPMYVAGIVGHDNDQESPNVNNCFSLKWQCHFTDENNKLFRYHIEGYNDIAEDEDTSTTGVNFKNRKPTIGNLLPSEDEHSSSGYVVSSVAQLTAITNASGIVTMPIGEDYQQAHSKKINTSSTTTHDVRSAVYLNSVYNKSYKTYVYGGGVEGTVETLLGSPEEIKENIKNATYGGWIFMPGCLPQLAMFALDTQDGLAMTSYGYGRNNQGEYVKQVAGSEFNPYVIKDGVDLLGLSALVTGGADDTYIDFDNKYIEFANGVNNLSGDVTTSIQMPQYIANYNRTGNVRDYTFNDNGTVKEGKSFQLYNRAANGHHGVKTESTVNASVSYTFSYVDSSNKTQPVNLGDKAPATSFYAKSQKTNGYFEYNKYTNTDTTVTTYSLWYGNHYVYTGSGYALCLDRDKKQTEPSMGNNVHNFNPIGYNGNAFMGNISGAIYYKLSDAEATTALSNGSAYILYNNEYVLYNANNSKHVDHVNEEDDKGNKVNSVYGKKQTHIVDLEVRGGYDRNDSNESYAGLFGLVEDAVIDSITVTGNINGYNSATNGTTMVGIVAKACGNTILTDLRAGYGNNKNNVKSVDGSLTLKTHSGASAYIGGIVGMADAGKAGNSLIIDGCGLNGKHDASNASNTVAVIIASHKASNDQSVGGILGYAKGDSTTSKIDIIRSFVYNADISSSQGHYVGGIVGKQASTGALSVTESQVGVSVDKNPTYNGKVNIKGSYAIGGIIAYTGANNNRTSSFNNCGVYQNVTIIRTDRETAPGEYGAAIGGLVGGVLDVPAKNSGNTVFTGELLFYGTINLGNHADSNNVGGAIGFMGNASRMERSIIVIGGAITIGEGGSGKNIGGFAGISKGVALDGAFYIYPTMTTAGCNNVGGFIGYNAGNTAVVRTAEIYTNYGPNTSGGYETKNSKISASENVGGFIGENATGATIALGVATYEGTNYGTDNDETVIQLGSSVDGTAKIGGLIGANYGTMYALECYITNIGHVGGDSTAIIIDNAVIFNHSIGGVVGYVGPAGEVIVTDDATIVNSGQVGNENYQTAYQEYVGGIIGASYGSIEIGSLGTLANTGSVYGYRYVGGVIGVVGSGTISGTLSNGSKETSQAYSSSDNDSEAMSAVEDEGREGGTGATVTAVQNVGGVIGVVMEDATISGATLENYGTVTADSSTSDSYTLFVDAQGNPLVYKDGTLVDQNDISDPNDDVVYTINIEEGKVVDSNGTELTSTKTFKINNVSNLGGVIGLHYGVIDNSSFNNYGAITAENFAGGAIGVSAGTISGTSATNQSEFVNHATLTFYGDTALGGAVGYITDSYEEHSPGGNTTGKNSSTVSNTYFSYEPANSTGDMTGERVTVEAKGTKVSGAKLKDDLTGGLGGVFGAIDSAEITEGTWTGNTFFIHGNVKGAIDKVDNVGGVVGIINGSHVTISNMLMYYSNVTGREHVGGIVGYNCSSNTNTGLDASIYNCYNVYGEVFAGTDEYKRPYEAGGIVGYVPGEAKTFASYWVKSMENKYLQAANPLNVADSINKAGDWHTFITASEYANNVDIGDKEYDIYAFSDEEIAKLIDEAVKAGKFNDAEGNPPTTTPTRQDYYDMLTQDAINKGYINEGEGTDDYRQYILNANGYLGTGDGRYANWSAYFEANPTVTVEETTYDYVRNGNGDWGYFGEATVNYNTGNTDGSTGYYYIFASDSKDYTLSDTKVITVDHKAVSGKLDEPYDDETLNYWLIIANSPNKEYDAYASSNVYGNGNVVPGVISATAYSAKKNGYYLYVNSTDPKATDINQSTIGTDTKVYASTQTTRTGANGNLLVAGNIMIFYKEYQSTTTLEYNGFYRYAPANDELGYQAEKVSVSEPENAVNYFNGHYYYTFNGVTEPVENGTINFGKNAGTYDTKAEIWTYDSNGQILVLGKVDTTDGDLTEDQLKKYKWEITPRQLSVKYSTPTTHIPVDGVTSQYTGKFSHYITVTVSGIALDETKTISNFQSGEEVKQLYDLAWPVYNGRNVLDLAYNENTGFTQEAGSTEFFPNGVDVVAYCREAGADGSIDTTNTIGSNETLAKAKYYTITYYVFAKNAGTYNITVGTDNNHKAPNTSGKIEVEKRKISLDIKYGTDYKDDTPGKFVFDGGVNWRGVTAVTINGIVSTDNILEVFGIRSSSNENGVVLAHTALNSTIGMISTSQTDYHMLDKEVLYLYSNDIGTYTATLTISSSGSVNYTDNYEFDTKSSSTAWYSKINSTSWSAEWTIEQYLINMKDKELIVEDRTVYYDGKKHSVDYRIEGFDMNDGTIGDDYGNEHYEISIKADGTGYAGGVNAGTYKIDQISINDGSFSSGVTRGTNSKAQSTDNLINYNITYPTADNVTATLRILERPIEIQWSAELENEFTYNGKEQGVTDAEDSIKLRVHMVQYDEEGNRVNDGTWQTVVGSISGDTITFVMPGDLNRETVSFTLSDLVAINEGSYTAKVSDPVALGTNDAGNTDIDNYLVKASPAFEHNYTIKPKEISVAWNNVTSTFKYNGKYQGFDASAVQFKVGETVKSVTIISETEFTVESGIGTEVLHFTIENFKAVNAGTYTANIKEFTSVTGSNTLTSNYQLTGVPTSKSYAISKLSISLVWSPDKTEFVYNGSAQGMDANDLIYKLDGTTKSVSISGNTLTAPGVNGETISFTIVDYTKVNAGEYTAVVNKPVASGTNDAGATSLNNYSVTGVPANQAYTIAKKEVTLTWADDIKTSFLYNGQKQGLDENSLIYEIVNGDNAGGKVTATIGNDGNIKLTGIVNGETLTINIEEFKAVNAGNYTAKVTYSGNTDNYTITLPSADMDYAINARQVKLSWQALPENHFVYSGSAQGLGAGNVLFEMQDESGAWVAVAGVSISGNTLTAKAVGNETIDFAIDNFKNTNAGDYTASIANEIIGVAGTNEAGTTVKENYNLQSVPEGANYFIDKSQIVISFNSADVDGKVFDGNSKVYAPLPSYSVKSTNGGANGVNVVEQKDVRYTNSAANEQWDVGTGYYVGVFFALNDADNYQLMHDCRSTANGDRYYILLKANAEITPRGLTVTLNTNGSTATKIFDNNDIYAVASATSDGTAKSLKEQFRTGRGITVEGFVTTGVTVTATYQETDREHRSQFDKYVNGVYLDGTTYKQANDTYYKQLYIALSGSEANNYYIAVVQNKAKQEILTQNGRPNDGNYIVVPDSRVKDSTTKDTDFQVTITPYSVKANYSHTVQSYANADNTYNTNWIEVTGSVDVPFSGLDNKLSVEVNNGWMGPEGNRTVYKKYTRIAGREGNATLGARVTSTEGYEYCVRLRNQPTLIIGYFVEKPDGYEIGTMAGLLIATEYYKGNFAPDGGKGYEYEETALDVTVDLGYDSWDKLFADPNFDITKTPIYKAIEKAIEDASSDADLKAALTVQLNSFEYSAEKDQWVYWKAKEILDDRKYDQFYLINNIDGILTASDMDILKGAFGTDFGGNWGVGTSFLGHVIIAEEGSVVIFSDSVFNTEFAGQLDGRGYTIDHLSITKTVTSAGEHNVGMFSEIRTDETHPDKLQAFVSDINFRNLSIYVIDASNSASTTINVGAVAGKYAGTSVMKNITVHGTISVKSTKGAVRVGGVIGYDTTGYVDSGISSVLERAIIVATLRGEGATAIVGGAIGVMSNPATSIAGIVSLSEVYAEGASTYANGYVGMYCVSGTALEDGINFTPATSIVEKDANNNDATIKLTSAFMDAVYEISATGEYTRIGGGKTYDELYNGSKTAFDSATGNYGEATKLEYGTYDVVKEKDAMSEANNTGSMRLVDMVDIYVLGYGLTDVTIDKLNTFHKESTSKYFHASGAPAETGYKPNGTDDNPIKIAYQQHLSLLRMFNYMNFGVTRDIKMYTGYKLAVVNEAFIGSVTSNSHVVNVRSAEESSSGKATLFAYQPLAFDWLVID